MTSSKTNNVNGKLMKVAEDAIKCRNDPVYGPWIKNQQEILYEDLQTAIEAYDRKVTHKYNTEPKFRAYADKVKGSVTGLEHELTDQNGWTFEDNDHSLENSAKEWKGIGMWSVGMTASKT
jgi:hypothetical protein